MATALVLIGLFFVVMIWLTASDVRARRARNDRRAMRELRRDSIRRQNLINVIRIKAMLHSDVNPELAAIIMDEIYKFDRKTLEESANQ